MENYTYYESVDSKAVKGRFFDKQQLLVLKSKEAGEKVYRTVPYVEILIAGKSDRFIAPVQDTHKDRFPEAWKAYIGEAISGSTGTPIEELEGVDGHLAFKLRSMAISTIQDLAVADSQSLGNMGFGLRDLRAKAQEITGITGNEKPADKTAAIENQKLKDELEELKKQMAALAEKPKRKRRTKAEIEAEQKVEEDDTDAA